jgi:hypothetical protein
VVEPIHSGLNSKFDVSIVFTAKYSFSGRRCPVDSEMLLMTDFVNLKIKPAQSFKNTHRDIMYVCVFIDVSARTCMSIWICTVFLKKEVDCGRRAY